MKIARSVLLLLVIVVHVQINRLKHLDYQFPIWNPIEERERGKGRGRGREFLLQ